METATLRRAALVVVVLTLVTGVVTAALGLALAASYRPWTAEPWTLPARAERDLDWLRWHRWATTAFILTSLVTAVLVIWLAVTGERRRLLLLTAPVALVTAAVTGITRNLVEWDQLALYSVTVGDDVDGYWHAAFGDRVRFVIVDGMEVTQGDYAWSVVLHLGAPVVGVLVLMGLIIALVRGGPTVAEEADGTT